jgi:hypothetical protein
MCVRMSTGVKNAHLHNVTFGFWAQIWIHSHFIVLDIQNPIPR